MWWHIHITVRHLLLIWGTWILIIFVTLIHLIRLLKIGQYLIINILLRKVTINFCILNFFYYKIKINYLKPVTLTPIKKRFGVFFGFKYQFNLIILFELNVYILKFFFDKLRKVILLISWYIFHGDGVFYRIEDRYDAFLLLDNF